MHHDKQVDHAVAAVADVAALTLLPLLFLLLWLAAADWHGWQPGCRWVAGCWLAGWLAAAGGCWLVAALLHAGRLAAAGRWAGKLACWTLLAGRNRRRQLGI